MSIELQLSTNALIELTRRTLRGAFRTICLPNGPGFSIDHLEVINSAITVSQVGNSVEMQIPADVFIVADEALFAAPNTIPQGATSAAGNIIFPVRLEVQRQNRSGSHPRVWLRLVPQPPILGEMSGPLGPITNALAQAVTGSLPTPRVEITRLLDILRIGELDQVDVVAGDDVVAVRFSGGGAAATFHLALGQQWAVYASGDALVRMIRGLIEPKLTGVLSIVSVEASYDHDSVTPRVQVTVGAMIDIFDVGIGAKIQLSSTIQLLPGPSPLLRITVLWGIHIKTEALIPIFGPIIALGMAPVAEAVATDIVSDALDVTSFGGVQTGDTSFVLDQPLPPLQLGLATLRYDSLVPDDAGMALGGTVSLGRVPNTPFELKVGPFGLPSRIQLCSDLAKSGSGNPSREPASLWNTRVYAQAEVEGAGRLCSIEMRSPGASWRSFINSPPDGRIIEATTLDVRMVYGVALSMPGPMSFVVRTPRGVRFVDFGRPPAPKYDSQGQLVLAMDIYIPDCLFMDRGWGFDRKWGKEDFKPPLEHPDWADYIRQSRGIIVQLLSVQGLDAGEFVRFHSATHSLLATADAEGRLTMPVFRPMAPAPMPALLERINGRPLAGLVSVETAAFELIAMLPGVLGQSATTPLGGLRVVTKTERGLVRHSIGAFGIRTSVELNPQPLPPGTDSDPAALNPQPLPPVENGDWDARQVAKLELASVRGVAWVPGFAGRQVALADVGVNDYLLLDLGGERIRIAGTLTGPVGSLSTSRYCGLVAADQHVMVFNRLEAPMPTPDVCREPNPRSSQ